MRAFNRIVCSILIGTILVSNFDISYAVDSDTTETNETQEVENSETEFQIDDLNVQLNDLYHDIGDKLNIDYIYVKMIHMIAGGKAVYADSLPNVYIDTTVDSLPAPFDIAGVNQEYNLTADWVYCVDENVARPSKYYMPDAAYNVTASVIEIMNSRYNADRGSMQNYFDAMSNSVKKNIIFAEAMLKYTGSSQEVVDSLFSIYSQMVYKKSSNDNVLVSDGNGNMTFKDEYLSILKSNGITKPEEIEILSIILRFDDTLASSESSSDIYESYAFPYEIDYPSRENMMAAALSLVGKVRYVWGGGHYGPAELEGINPMWQVFNNSYGRNNKEPGYGCCIMPSTTWCPLHGYLGSTTNGCLFSSKTVYNTNQYLDERKNNIDISSLNNDNYRKLINSMGIDKTGLQSHRLDGLDCSGFASWLYNQVTDSYHYDSSALYFTKQYGVKSLGVGNELLPGDVYTWGSHIVVIVGKAAERSKAYVMVEATPDILRCGVVYYSGAKAADINLAKNIAIEANQLLGGLNDDTEPVRVYNMNTTKFREVETITTTDENGNTVTQNVATYRNGFHDCGRANISFIDENTVLSDTNKKFKDMTAREIIQHTLNNFTYDYITGYKTYKGKIFDISHIDDNMKTEVIEQETSNNEGLALTSDLVVMEDKQEP